MKMEYAIKLISFFSKKGGGNRNNNLLNRLLYGTLIEVRSCGVLKLFQKNWKKKNYVYLIFNDKQSKSL